MALRSGLDPIYVGPDQLNSQSTEQQVQDLFKDVAVWIQPGGKSRTALTAMTPKLVQSLKDYVFAGGGYVGFCAGAFSATPLVGTSSIPGLNIIPGKSILYRYRQAAGMIPLQWNGKKRYVYWEGGPYLSALNSNPQKEKVEVIATYPNGQVATARTMYGKGRVFVTGLHPEAPQDWRDYYGLKDRDGVDFDLVDEMLAWVQAQ
jgi:glutamine amidotransferase-like uncharacterized protein